MSDPRVPHVSGRRRVNSCAAVGVVAAAAASPLAPWQLSVLIGWTTWSALLLVWIWIEITGCDAQHTRDRSTREDTTHGTAAAVMVTASVGSLAAVALGLAKARHASGASEVALTVGAVLAVLLSWFVLNSMFTLRYAHEYYRDTPGGIAFVGDEAPDYADFAYFAFTIGMAFAVSDVPIASRRIRRIALRHALLSYFFGAVIIGLTINVMAGFIR
ncbi:MAG: DUF1345 domain-containing protein [Actinomycetota bacterium]